MLYDFCKDSKLFSVDEIDTILMQRLSKDVKIDGKPENKFKYLYESYRRMADHLLARHQTTAD